jgi:hypothetical protein
MEGVREERFEGLEYLKKARIRYERVEDSNSCVRIFIFDSFFIIVLSKKFPFLFLLSPFCFLT